jgi:hypothetical protein
MRRHRNILAIAAVAICLACTVSAFVPSTRSTSSRLASTSVRRPTTTTSCRITARTTRLALAPVDPEAISTAVTVAAASTGPLAGIMNNLTSLLVLALIVAVHELGHFIGARSQGIKVRNFSIGFGPTLLSFKEGPEEDDIEYTLRAIPMGGFVSFPPHYEQDADGELIR